MTYEEIQIEILEKAIRKAIKNGYIFASWDILNGLKYKFCKKPIQCVSYIEYDVLYNGAPIAEMNEQIAVRDVIFTHAFAKAFFGKCKNPDGGPLCVTHCCDITNCITWQEHLQEMVLEKNPLKYIKRFLN